MLLDGHELDGVVAQALDAREDCLAEDVVGVDVGLTRGGHANMRLVDAQRPRGNGELVLELVLFGWVPEDRVVVRVRRRALGRLHRVVRPRWDTCRLLAGGGRHGDLVPGVVGDDALAVHVRDVHRPDAKLILLVGVLSAVPSVEVSEQRHVRRARRPLSADDAWHGRVLGAEHTEPLVAEGEVLEGPLHVDDALLQLLVLAVPVLEASLAAVETLVPLDHLAPVLGLPVLVRDLVPGHVLGHCEVLAALLGADSDGLVLGRLVPSVHDCAVAVTAPKIEV
mmetsp:Transcript_36716/g.74117  ORF Transcript_36716/g.74117 Transcript_36716/m.74117 type:complete len:281 (+) Transcript_36716:693-1535(+)